jgi:uncharacterized protein (DUF58 family)
MSSPDLGGWTALLAALSVLAFLAIRWLGPLKAGRASLFWALAGLLLLVGAVSGSLVIWQVLATTGGVLGFVLKGSLLLAALALLGHSLRIFPDRPMVYVLLVPAALSIALLITPLALPAVLVVDGLALLVAIADLATLPRQADFVAGRQTGRIASLKKPHPVALWIENRSRRRYWVWIRDRVAHELNPQPDEFQLAMSGRSRATMRYHLHSTRRGAFTLSTVHLKVRSRLGLWQRLLDYPLSSVIHIYPDMKQLAEYALLARTNRLNLLGVRRTRRIGQDNEFERLRDYTLDDNYKHIDWRSTARRRKLTVKDFQTNQSQRLVFMLDCGRMMTSEAAGLSLLDHALNAMLMLSYVALSHGDSVGLLSFSDEIHGFVPPASGLKQMNRLLHASFDRFPRLVESRYDQAFLYLATHSRKRSLVILISNLIDEVNANQVGQYLRSVVGRHLPLGVMLRDRRLFDAAEAPLVDEEALFRAAAGADILIWRNQVLADLDAAGVRALDVYPEELTAPLVNSYLEIKARHLL